MSEIDSKTFINGVGNDLKIAIDDFVGIVVGIKEDVEKLKIKTSKPNKDTAKALLEYIGMEEGRAKKNMEILCGDEIKEYLKWINAYCEEYCCSQEEALNLIIEGKI